MAALPRESEPDGDIRLADPGFGIYVHWPFCAAKCPYCDFNSHVPDTPPDEKRLLAAYRAELAHFAALAPGRTVSSVFFGGGTPSLMSGETVAGILDAIARLWPLAGDAEITLEANPTSAEAARFARYRSAGVNRLSLGVQSLRDDALAALGRRHGAREAVAALETARSLFPRFSFDLIYARSGQQLADWRVELAEALALAGDHLSLYQLTIERGTPFFARQRRGELQLPDDDLARDFYDLTQDLCQSAGMPAYEISNHARPGGASRHNLTYWRSGDYVGVGAGAHGRIGSGAGRRATAAIARPSDWAMAWSKMSCWMLARRARNSCSWGCALAKAFALRAMTPLPVSRYPGTGSPICSPKGCWSGAPMAALPPAPAAVPCSTA